MGAKVTTRPPTYWDCLRLATDIRNADRLEITASSGKDPATVIFDAVRRSSECYAVFFGDKLACIWGVVMYSKSFVCGAVGVGWLLTTDAIEKAPKLFWKHCLEVLPSVLSRWDVLINAIDVRHAQALRWAKRLGFRLAEPEPFGVYGMDFQPFRVEKGDLCVNQPQSLS